MAVTMKTMSIIVAIFGSLSFIFGVIAENKKPASGIPITGRGVVICKYLSDPTVVLGYLSVGFLLASTVVGYFSLFYAYKGKSVPQGSLFRNSSFSIFFNIAIYDWVSPLVAAMAGGHPTPSHNLKRSLRSEDKMSDGQDGPARRRRLCFS